tara:strand:- start:535 stop:1329 length:795 start_codon:yes stop_codon:yes gene_type:complete
MTNIFTQNSVTKRFIKVYEQLKKDEKFRSASAFAKSIDYTPQAFNEVLKERRDIPVDSLYKFFNLYNIDPAIIFMDDTAETTLNREYKPYSLERNDVKIHSVLVDSSNTEQVPLIDKKASAGYLQEFQDENYFAKLNSVSLPPSLEHKSLYGFQVEGDSMEPNLYDSDWVYCSLIEKLDYIQLNHIYIIVAKSGIVVKRVTEMDKENMSVELTSDNKSYPPYKVPYNEILQVWYLDKALTGHFPQPDDVMGKLEKLEQLINRKL